MNSCLLESDCEEFESESIEENSNVISFYKEIEPVIKICINNYFSDKFLHDGRKIPKELLDLSYYSSLLFNTSISDGVLKAYFLIEENNFLVEKIKDDQAISEEIRYMINLIRNIQKIIPQEFVGGMILMHLELIEGIETW